MSRINVRGPEDVRAIEVRLYITREKEYFVIMQNKTDSCSEKAAKTNKQFEKLF